MFMAINYDEIVEEYYGGEAERSQHGIFYEPVIKGFSRPFEDWPDEVRAPFLYDPEKAMQLLADAGYPDGFKVVLDLTSAHDMDLVQFLKNYWAAIGVEVELNVLESNAVMTSRAISGVHDMCYQGWRATMTYPVDRIGVFTTGNKENYAHWSDARYDELYELAMSSTDYDEFQDYVIEASDRYIASFIIIPTPYLHIFNFWQPWLKGGAPNNLNLGGSNYFHEYARYWVDQSKK